MECVWEDRIVAGSALSSDDYTSDSGSGPVMGTIGLRTYELTNHLGNVLATITDNIFQVLSQDGNNLSHNEADVVSAQDYYPFGMLMPGRQWENAAKFRYGFNGKENDNEIQGEGNQQDYGMRIYDPRVGKFLSTDPLASSYAYYTPYQFAGDSPIKFVDLDGLEPSVSGSKVGETQTGTNGNNNKAVTWSWDGKKWGQVTLNEVVVVGRKTPTKDEKDAIDNSTLPRFPYDIRTAEVDFSTIFHEFEDGTGPVSSVFLDNHPLT